MVVVCGLVHLSSCVLAQPAIPCWFPVQDNPYFMSDQLKKVIGASTAKQAAPGPNDPDAPPAGAATAKVSAYDAEPEVKKGAYDAYEPPVK